MQKSKTHKEVALLSWQIYAVIISIIKYIYYIIYILLYYLSSALFVSLVNIVSDLQLDKLLLYLSIRVCVD